MPSAAAPPMIAPGIVCPKCKGPMLDERQTKRSEKSPDYTCANLTCVETKNGKSYRTAIWAKDAGNGSAGGEVGKPTASTSASAPPASSDKPTMREAYRSLTQWVMSDIAPLYATDDWTDLSAETIASITATLFIQACKAGKVQ